MRTGREFDPLRRAIVLIPILFACRNNPAHDFPQAPDVLKPAEDEVKARNGGVVFDGDKFYVIRAGKKYLISDFPAYRKTTKFDQYGRKVLPRTRAFINDYEEGVVDSLPMLIDPFSGVLKENKPKGGEITLFFPGFTDDNGEAYSRMIPEVDTFTSLRKALRPKKWIDEDEHFFTYGSTGMREYTSEDTTRDPRVNIKHALNSMDTLSQNMPLAQKNGIGHSLGGLLLLEAAMGRPDDFNNLIFISAPLFGIQKTTERAMAVGTLHNTLVALGIDEKVTDYLFALHEDKTHRERVLRFFKDFTASGRKIVSICAGEDPIVPAEASFVDGHTRVYGDIKEYGWRNMQEAIANKGAHARLLGDPKAVREIADMIGEKIAA